MTVNDSDVDELFASRTLGADLANLARLLAAESQLASRAALPECTAIVPVLSASRRARTRNRRGMKVARSVKGARGILRDCLGQPGHHRSV